MKKIAVVLFFLVIMIFAVNAVASAQNYQPIPDETYVPTPVSPDDPFNYGSKYDYYYAIQNLLTKINASLAENDVEAAQKVMSDLRLLVYRCARYLVEINQYDWRIMNVLVFADEAFAEQAKFSEHLEESRALAEEILLGKRPVTPGGDYTPYGGGTVTEGGAAAEDAGEEDAGESTGGESSHS